MLRTLTTMKGHLAERGVAWPSDWPDPDRVHISGHSGRPGPPLMADIRPVMASLAPLQATNVMPEVIGWIRQMLPSVFMCMFGHATTDVCLPFIMGSGLYSLNKKMPAILGVHQQNGMEHLPPQNRKGRCADLLPPAPPPPPIPPPLPSAYETRGISWKGHLMVPNGFPRGAVQSYKAAATKTAALWPSASSPQPRNGVGNYHLDVRARERDDALRYMLGPSGIEGARERSRGREGEIAAKKREEDERAEREAAGKTVPTASHR